MVSPGEAGYDAARSVSCGGIDRYPAAIVLARDTSDVSLALSIAREGGLELAVRGGHGLAGHGMTDCGIAERGEQIRRRPRR